MVFSAHPQNSSASIPPKIRRTFTELQLQLGAGAWPNHSENVPVNIRCNIRPHPPRPLQSDPLHFHGFRVWILIFLCSIIDPPIRWSRGLPTVIAFSRSALRLFVTIRRTFSELQLQLGARAWAKHSENVPVNILYNIRPHLPRPLLSDPQHFHRFRVWI